MRHTSAPVRLLATLAATATVAALVTTVLGHRSRPRSGTSSPRGLDNPRQLSFTGSNLYVAEAGTGGHGPCVTGAEGEVCLGTTGAITRVMGGHQSRVLSRLPSLAAEDGSGALGPHDVFVVRPSGRYAVSIGLGNDPAVKDDLGWRGRRLGTVVRGVLDDHWPRVSADLAAYEAANDPDGLGPDSNPTGLIRRPRGAFVLTDSGGNTLLRSRFGHITRLATFGSPGDAPPKIGGFPIQPVPTSVAVGPDGAFYVSELTGFPFLPGLARIHRVVPGMPSTVYATGLTNATDLGWHDGALYAVQIADGGLQAGPIGSLVRVDPGGNHSTVAGGLFAPYGVAFHNGSAYVTTCSVCPDAGEVIRVPLT